MIRLKIPFLFVFQFVFFFSNGQPGANDPSFNPDDQGFGFGDGPNDIVYTSAIQSDGKIIIGGSFTSYNGRAMNRIARLNVDGSLDTTFHVGTAADNQIRKIAIQNDGKIIVGGDYTIFNGANINRIARLNSDGSLDATFNVGTGTDNSVRSISIQSDGKIIIGGWFISYNAIASNYIARLNTSGSLDASFNIGTGADNYIHTTAIQNDGKIIIGGDFTGYNSTPINLIARLNTDGSLDATFNVGTGVDNSVLKATIQSDGKILIGGAFTSYNSIPTYRIARLNTNGSIDASFIIGTGADDEVISIAIQSDGKIIVGGAFANFNGTAMNGIVRLESDGTQDAGFIHVMGKNSIIYTIALQSDGEIIIGGYFGYFTNTGRNYIARLDTDGSLDPQFNPNTGANSWVYSTAIQSDGKILIGGYFTVYNNTFRNYIARLNNDGTLDSSFNPGAGANSWINTMAIQSDGKIIIAGNFTSYDSTDRNFIARLNSDGSLDDLFDPGTGANDPIQDIAIQSDGKIIIVGNFTDYDGTGRNRIARLNSDGSLDTSFDPGTGANSNIRTIAIQNDGRLLIGGEFSAYNGTGRNFIARLNTGGSLDGSFDPGTGANSYVYKTIIQNDQKILIAGLFTSFNGTGRNYIARLNVDGSLDFTFDPGTGANSWINAMIVQSNGEIIIGGDFTSYDGISRIRLAGLESNGSLDPDFDSGAGADLPIWTMALQSDGKIIIGGGFTTYNTIGRNRIARVLNNCLPPDITTSLNGNIITANQNGANYQWIDCDNGYQVIASQTNQCYLPTANGNYAVIVSLNGCIDTSSCVCIVITGMTQTFSGTGQGIILYPNPNKGAFTIASTQDGNYMLKNDLGETVQSFNLNSGNNYTIDISEIRNGIYFIIGINDLGLTRQKVIVAE